MPAETIARKFELALSHHKANRIDDAKRLYDEVIDQAPGHGGALFYRAAIAHQEADHEKAISLLRRCIELNPKQADYYNILGASLDRQGKPKDAASAYRTAIALRPDFTSALANLGGILVRLGKLNEAIDCYRRVIALNPHLAGVHEALAAVLQRTGDMPAAIAVLENAARLTPASIDRHLALGAALLESGRYAQALKAYATARDLNPQQLLPHAGIAQSFYHLGNYAHAIAAAQHAISLDQRQPTLFKMLGKALLASGCPQDALVALNRAIELQPEDAESHHAVGNALCSTHRLEEGIGAYQKAIELAPNYAATYSNLATALADVDRTDEACEALNRALSLQPDSHQAMSNLSQVLASLGQIQEAIALQRRAIELAPNDPGLQSTLQFFLAHDLKSDEAAIAEENRRWAARHALPLAAEAQPHNNNPNPDRRLKVGYISRFLHDNADWHDLLPLLSNHDHSKFEIFSFSDTGTSDDATGMARKWSDHWVETAALSDAQLAQAIRDHHIDIAVLHLPSQRLLAMARKPAPVQVTWLLSASSAGIEMMDYRISDPFVDPVGWDESCYSEKTFRLPHTAWCFDPLVKDVPCSDLPATKNGFITFGSLNRLNKINSSVVALWSEVLSATPDSRLLMLAPQGQVRQRIVSIFQSHGISPDRIHFLSRLKGTEYLKAYHEIDIVLDTFPYNGHNTSRDALWMGVPVVSLSHRRPVGQVGASLLANIGLTEFLAKTPDEFVAIAKDLAGDRVRLTSLRSTLRQRMASSPLMDGKAFALDMESAYRTMWRDWVKSQK
jgi:predicted O-linked N-acetylglucosamine transferase (SPINDLY family)